MEFLAHIEGGYRWPGPFQPWEIHPALNHLPIAFLLAAVVVEWYAWLRGRPFFSFSGIGSPRTFHAQLAAAGGQPAGSRAFPDHHAYTDADITSLVRDARACGAEMLLTTEKDWVLLRLGEPLSVTLTTKVLVLGPWTSVGDQVSRPLPPLTMTPLGPLTRE